MTSPTERRQPHPKMKTTADICVIITAWRHSLSIALIQCINKITNIPSHFCPFTADSCQCIYCKKQSRINRNNFDKFSIENFTKQTFWQWFYKGGLKLSLKDKFLKFQIFLKLTTPYLYLIFSVGGGLITPGLIFTQNVKSHISCE